MTADAAHVAAVAEALGDVWATRANDEVLHVHLWELTSWRSDFGYRHGGTATLTCVPCSTKIKVCPWATASLDLGEANAERDALAAEVEGQTLVARSYEQERDAARSRLVDATAQIKRLAAENARLRADLANVNERLDFAVSAGSKALAQVQALATTEAGAES